MRSSSAASLRAALSGSIAQGTLERFLSSFSADELAQLHYDFELWARDDQLPPSAAQRGGAWTVWLKLGGRGAGKTRAGAEWARAVATADPHRAPFAPPPRIALIGETLADARSIMVESVSGLLAVHPPRARPVYEPSKRQVT
jgi:phage terminase large subunit-like protein